MKLKPEARLNTIYSLGGMSATIILIAFATAMEDVFLRGLSIFCLMIIVLIFLITPWVGNWGKEWIAYRKKWLKQYTETTEE